MSVTSVKNLTGLEKACILLLSLGTNISAEVFRHMSQGEIEKLSAQILKMREIDPAIIQAVIREFEEIATTKGGVSGGKDFAIEVLQQVVGEENATKLLDKASVEYRQPFESLWNIDNTRLARALENENPQVIALVLTYLPPDKSAAVLAGLSDEIQAAVAHRICVLDQPEQDVMVAIEDAIRSSLSETTSTVVVSTGPKTLVEILNNAERSTEKLVLGSLQEQDPVVGEQVRSMMFVFEDLVKLEDRSVQLVLREIDQEDLRLALKGASEDIRNLIFGNMSERAAEMLKEDLELVGNIKQKDLEAAQQRVVMIVRRLLSTGEATLGSAQDAEAFEADGSADSEWDAMMKEFGGDENGGGDAAGGETSSDQGDQIDMAA